MVRCGLLCLVIVPFFLVQTVCSQSGPSVQKAATSPSRLDAIAFDQSKQAKISNVAPDAPVIIVDGLCDDALANKTRPFNCKTVITRVQFERVIDAIQPGMPGRARREFALDYVNFLMMAKKAEQMGLDKGADYDEQMKLARIQVLSRDLKRVIQEKASRVSDKEIEDYYRNNTAKFEEAEINRIYIPKSQQLPSNSDKKLSDPDMQTLLQESEQAMKREAENLRARAATGEDFVKLQADAYQFAGIKSAAPNTSMTVRRTSLPPNQASVMDLKPGEISSVLAESNGYVIYRIKAKEEIPLIQAREEIKATLRSQQMQDELRGIQDSLTPILDEGYFAH